MDQIDEKIRYHRLFDLYQGLLTEKQKTYFQYYYLDDYSLSEIAEIQGVSRNAVHDQLKIAIAHLEEYESVLKLESRNKVRAKLIAALKERDLDEETKKLVERIERLEE
ncbi:MAG: sigma factor-like helix-turn-helix DNA-binding protein [Candidatus Izemoplasmatales bacterium]|nr:sigma factor-like helix-turn-helix DNA-binding protein [Candidatus Izemoplasmatales bacterium]